MHTEAPINVRDVVHLLLATEHYPHLGNQSGAKPICSQPIRAAARLA